MDPLPSCLSHQKWKSHLYFISVYRCTSLIDIYFRFFIHMQFTCHNYMYMHFTPCPMLLLTHLDFPSKTCVPEDWRPLMWCCVTGCVTPGLSKDHKAFICRVKQSKMNSHVGEKCLCYINMVDVGSKWLERVQARTLRSLPLPWLTDCHPLWPSTTHINNAYITHQQFCPMWLFFLDCLNLMMKAF